MKQLGLFGDDKPVEEPAPRQAEAQQLSLFSGQEVIQFGVTTAAPQCPIPSFSMQGGLFERKPDDKPESPGI